MRRVATEHCDTGAKLGAAKRDHVLSDRLSVKIPHSKQGTIKPIPNMTGNQLTLVRRGVHEDPLDQVVAILISGNW